MDEVPSESWQSRPAREFVILVRPRGGTRGFLIELSCELFLAAESHRRVQMLIKTGGGTADQLERWATESAEHENRVVELLAKLDAMHDDGNDEL